MKQLFFFIIFLLATISSSKAQSLQELQEQRKKTENSIALTNKLLKQNSKSKNQELSNIKLISKKIDYREKLIRDIDKEAKELSQIIKEKQQTIESYEVDLEEMKENYAELLQFMWTRRSHHNQLMYILAGEDIGQIYRRFRYLSEFSEYQKSQAKSIEELTLRLTSERDSLSSKKDTQSQLISKYSTETQKLSSEKNSKEKKISQLKSKEKELKKQLIAQQKKRDELKKHVEKLIAEEAKKTTKTASGKIKLTPEQKLTSDKFEGNKGKLPWPVANGIISERYGKHKHVVYSDVEVENDGIDIRSEKGTNARSIFEGVVTSVMAIPGYNKGIIIRHGEFLTFYANLSEVYVKKVTR